MVRLRKPSLQKLADEYIKRNAEAEAFKSAFEKIPPFETSYRLEIAKDMLHKHAKVNEAILKIVDRFSPIAAKELGFKLKNHMKIVEDRLSRDYSSLPKFRNMPESFIKDIINSDIDNSTMFNELHRQFASIVFIAVVDAMERTRGKPPVELDEYLRTRLHNLNPKYAELYEGAWQALESKKPDRFRHCAASNRQLVRSLIGEKSPERKAKLKSILKSDTVAELIESLADTVDRLHKVLSKGVHEEIDYETALLSLRITEHLLRFTFAHLQEPKKERVN